MPLRWQNTDECRLIIRRQTVTGLTAVNASLVAATHGGSVMVRDAEGWTVAASFPVPGDVTGRYTPLLWFEN